MKKLICLLLALVMCIALLPMTALAEVEQDDTPVGSEISKPVKKETWAEKQERLRMHLDAPNKHDKLSWSWNAKYHWKQCSCGAKYGMERHIDPKDAPDDYCTCGYHFSSNADLVTLWVSGCKPGMDFNSAVTDYTLNTVTYKDVKSVKISTRTANSRATVELPEDLTLKTGTNIIPVKVTSENQKVVKTYTLTIVKD